MTQTTAIGFFCHTKRMPTPDDMMRGYELIEAVFNKLGAKPTYFSADDGFGRGGYKKVGGAFQKRVLNQSAAGYRSVGLAANPADSDAPGYDSFVSMDFAFGPEGEEVYLALTANESFLRIGSGECEEIIAEIAEFWQWDYGFGFERDAFSMPGIYLVGGASDRQSEEDRRRGEKWYACYQPEERRKRVRDIFPYNVIGAGHLANGLLDGRSLRTFIATDQDSELLALTDNLWLWKVSPDRTEAVRTKLGGSSIVISE
ncbi:hypothetical protein [Sphingomonas elodea]|uniref:hypothetical protein n=1 Tax=Sphingomonas elodea TaxID=179878 RepID=UPI001110ABFB|nr:hypothetical protein [Sphingomonas elodea]